jgi:hypothetical protein
MWWFTQSNTLGQIAENPSIFIFLLRFRMTCILALEEAFSVMFFSWRQIKLIIYKYGLNQLCKMVNTEIFFYKGYFPSLQSDFSMESFGWSGKTYI